MSNQLSPAGADALFSNQPEPKPARYAVWVFVSTKHGWRRLGACGTEAGAWRFALKAMESGQYSKHSAWSVRKEQGPPDPPATGDGPKAA
jgi:hypothetical protein